jgi:hypothetical protein
VDGITMFRQKPNSYELGFLLLNIKIPGEAVIQSP